MSKKHSKGKHKARVRDAHARAGAASTASGTGGDSVTASISREDYAIAPWHIVRADDKRLARLNLMRDILSRLHYEGKKRKLVQPDRDIAFEFTPDCIDAERLAR